jgi:branched-subunit amino acid ABC-type transport system permease component
VLALIRPTDWNWLLFGHLLAAFALVAGVIVVCLTSLAATRPGRPELATLLRSIGLRANLIVVIPAFIAIHVLGGILADREFPGDSNEPSWLGTSFAITTIVTLVAVALAFLQYWTLRRTRAGSLSGWPGQVAASVPLLVLAALAAVIVLMAGKPS